MANQIVTLKDDNNNPTFPIAGGMAEDSITTQMLKDGSVTSDKIDFATHSYQPQKIGTWVDGKPIYRALFYGSLPAGGNNVLLGNIPAKSVVLNVYGYANRNGYWTSINASYGNSIASIVQITVQTGEVRGYYDSVYVGGAYNLYIEYVAP